MCEGLHELLCYCFICIIYQIIKYLVILRHFRGFYGVFVVLWLVSWVLGGVCLKILKISNTP